MVNTCVCVCVRARARLRSRWHKCNWEDMQVRNGTECQQNKSPSFSRDFSLFAFNASAQYARVQCVQVRQGMPPRCSTGTRTTVGIYYLLRSLVNVRCPAPPPAPAPPPPAHPAGGPGPAAAAGWAGHWHHDPSPTPAVTL